MSTDRMARSLWLPIVTLAIIAGGLFNYCGFHIKIHDWIWCFGPALGTAIFGELLTRMGASRIAAALTSLSQFTFVTTSAMMLTIATATSPHALADATLYKIDTFLGYDWRMYASFVHNHPTLESVVNPSYWLIYVEPPLIMCYLASIADVHRLNKFILLHALTLLFCVVIFYFMPATQAWTYLGYSDGQIVHYGSLSPSENSWVSDLLLIRSGALRDIQQFTSSGIIAFPSFHTISALIFIWAAWPFYKIRAAAVILNVSMIAATPIIGGHYMSDLIAGGIVFAVSFYAVQKMYSAAVISGPFGMTSRARSLATPAA